MVELPWRGGVQLWDIRVKGCIQTFAEEYQVTSVAFADASDKVYTGGIDNTVRTLLKSILIF